MIKAQLKNSQLMFLIIGYIYGSTYVFRFVSTVAKQDTWIVIILGYILSIPFLLCYFVLMKMFPGNNLLQILDIVYKPVLGKIFAALYIFFFLSLFYLNLSTIIEFYTSYIMPETPPVLLYIFFVLACAYAVKKGIAAIAKISLLVIVASAFVLVAAFLLLFSKTDFTNFLPVFKQPVRSYIQSTHNVISITFCETAYILMLIPYVNDIKKSRKYIIGGVGIAAFTYIVIAARNISVLGASTSAYITSTYNAVRLINIGDFLSRMELIIALTVTATLFIKICISYFLTVKSLSQTLGLKTYIPMIVPIGVIGIILALIAFENGEEAYIYGTKYYIFFTMPFEIFIPLLTLFIAKIRKLDKRKGEVTV